MYVFGRFVVTSVVVLLFVSPTIRLSGAQSESLSPLVPTQTVVPVGPFTSVELRGGGVAVIRNGPTPQVTLRKGSLDYTNVTVVKGGRLVIDKCKTQCPKKYDLEVEIVIPDITKIVVADGGTIQSRGNFPRQAKIGLVVSNGGTIDIRSMAVDKVIASVDEGGRIFTTPQTAMLASIVNGGNITYWGNAEVESSVQRGGVITKGSAAEANAPLSELSPALTALSPILPLDPIQAPRKPKR